MELCWHHTYSACKLLKCLCSTNWQLSVEVELMPWIGPASNYNCLEIKYHCRNLHEDRSNCLSLLHLYGGSDSLKCRYDFDWWPSSLPPHPQSTTFSTENRHPRTAFQWKHWPRGRKNETKSPSLAIICSVKDINEKGTYSIRAVSLQIFHNYLFDNFILLWESSIPKYLYNS